jgi:hypothetical protein
VKAQEPQQPQFVGETAWMSSVTDWNPGAEIVTLWSPSGTPEVDTQDHWHGVPYPVQENVSPGAVTVRFGMTGLPAAVSGVIVRRIPCASGGPVHGPQVAPPEPNVLPPEPDVLPPDPVEPPVPVLAPVPTAPPALVLPPDAGSPPEPTDPSVAEGVPDPVLFELPHASITNAITVLTLKRITLPMSVKCAVRR